MLDLINQTPFQAAWNLFCEACGSQRLVVVVKATFALPRPGQRARPAPEQVPVLPEDAYCGQPGRSSLKYPADLVPQKGATDIGLSGTARSRDSRPVTHMPVSLQVGGVKKLIVVFGDRRWEKTSLGRRFRLTAPEPFTRMPLVYERAFGGSDKDQVFELNPVGTGFAADPANIEGVRLPNLENLHRRIKTPHDRPPVAGFGFVAPMWQGRLQYAGTCDDQWRRNRFPLPPGDFNPRFYNAAADGLTADGFLKGGEPVKLSNLTPAPLLEFNLPRPEFIMAARIGGRSTVQPAAMQTVLFEPDDQRFYLVWSAAFDAGKQPGHIDHVKVTLTGGQERAA